MTACRDFAHELGTEDAAEGSGPIPAEPLEAWQRTVPQARALIGDADVTQYEQESCDLSRSDTSRWASWPGLGARS
ncbi:hypothetical protein [Streptomyces sp. NPDC057696]|uniref:hypothetical protein n=1 Tax=Streptomyces sp. NPDC057696 TaxID=3346218 RepID=UPI003679F80B